MLTQLLILLFVAVLICSGVLTYTITLELLNKDSKNDNKKTYTEESNNESIKKS